MDDESENLSLFLHRVEASARKILRKNNELRSSQERRQMHSTSSALWKTGRLKDERKVSSQSNEGVTIAKSNEDVTFDKAGFRSRKEIVKSKNHGKQWNRESVKGQSCHHQKSENDVDMDMDISSAFLRKRYRSDENLVTNLPEHPLKVLLTQHVEDIRSRVNKMTEKRLSSFAEDVYNDCAKSVAEIKSKLARENESICDDQIEAVESMTDFCSDDYQDILSELHDHSPIVLEPSSRRIPRLPPQRWPLAVLEPMTPWNEWHYVSINRYCPNIEDEIGTREKNMSFFVVDFHDKTQKQVERYILYEHDIDNLCNPSINENCWKDYKDLGVVYETQFDFNKMDDYAMSTTGTLAVQVIRASNNNTCKLLARITVSLNQNGNCFKKATIDVPMNVIIATLDLFYLTVSNDESFWTSKDNHEAIWARLVKYIYAQVDEEDGIQLNLRVSGERSAKTMNWSGICRDIGKTDFVEALGASSNLITHLTAPPDISRAFANSLHHVAKVDQPSKVDMIQEMETQLQLIPSLALRLSGPLALSKDLIPGVCSIPLRLNWEAFGNSSNFIDSTEVAITFNRETATSPLTVTTRAAFQYPIEAPKFKVFDKKQMIPESASHKPVQGPIPLTMAKAKSILTEELESLVDARCPGPVTLIDVSAVDEKKRYLLYEYPKELNDETSEFFSEHGFRTKAPVEPFLKEKPFPLHTFGISEKGLSPNSPITSERTYLHSTEVCDYLLSEERNSKDFMHMIQNPYSDKDGGYPNDPLISIIHMNGYQVGRVEGIKKNDYLKQEEKMIQEQEEKKKKEILSLKMKAADRLLKEKLPHIYNGEDDSVKTENSKSTHSPLPSKIVDESSMADDPRTQRSCTWRNLDDTLPEGIDLWNIGSNYLPAYENRSVLITLNTICDIVKPSEAIDHILDDDIFQIAPTTMFIQDLLEDRFQMSHKKHQEQRSRDIILNAEQEVALDHIIRLPLEASNTVMDTSSNLLEAKSDVGRRKAALTATVENDTTSNEMKAILAARHADFEALEYLLDEIGVDIDTLDEHGNSLLIIAAQQGNKKLCKFLLRRGAYINVQNHQGNTVLHYLYEYGHVNLAEYLIQKGADDSFLNFEGLTCFEGTSRMKLDNL